ncbi:aminotransferase class I/II-fold pyridoxal phosphate-dependent enzyme [Algibacter amylolyticus]|uniref:Aminotransferase class I/II-fold pyridoxal phosphate-dependent enzyme n=1 Tax=Algibacter amylolyticus TaxID=1608400 RepID=A0A5M7B843_9FLAO|nr:aminotransferase class I/II-fold pyridoxal phosphate-dependent enzyme [Algibacter amylolyticus]KAA5825582.1 aminotransferase class I/II-fold pyridoxal phosphate-dependent enzyme [Algibacter amylolyticus]MBB5268192.1 dTDP-4-amino-4,6-dideoxygalactose transaminase [Algibacter amylolyticus]TSJ79880.1 aminotransferase class I/II-fold pyridoxal phosphate-dependent enzyme [Algibacter amylolyticus]
MLTKTKIYLSSPHMGTSERKFVADAFDTNWIAPLGPHVDGFENDIKKYLGNSKEVAVLSSGTASIHMALQLLGVTVGDEVLCQSFTFSASANPILYQGATPVFIDSESDTWNMCPELLEIAIRDRIKKHKKPKAIIAVHLYGMPYKANEINAIAKKYDIPVIEDSAEALGSSYFDKKCGILSDIGIISFNGNKIITTSGGGALVVNTEELKQKAVFYSTQSRDNAPHYEHSSIGFNYRMSNVLAGIGRGQMEVIDDRVHARKQNFEFYKKHLSQFEEITFLEEPDNFFSNRWITCIETPSYELREKIRLEFLKDDIESRPLWKPMHVQPLFKDSLHFTNGTSEDLFQRGLCLPSGSNLSQDDLLRILTNITKTLKL